MKLKTLKDIYKEIENFDNISQEKKTERYLTLKILRKEAVKWVKEDREVLSRLHEDDKNTWEISIKRWMKRLDIKEEELGMMADDFVLSDKKIEQNFMQIMFELTRAGYKDKEIYIRRAIVFMKNYCEEKEKEFIRLLKEELFWENEDLIKDNFEKIDKLSGMGGEK